MKCLTVPVGRDEGVRVVGFDDVGLDVYGSVAEQVLDLCEKGKQRITRKHWNNLQDFVW
jgi:hypothetical protein